MSYKPVGRPSVQSFVGALAGQDANSGISITKSSFSKDVKDYAEQYTDQLIVLIDGVQLGHLLVCQALECNLEEVTR